MSADEPGIEEAALAAYLEHHFGITPPAEEEATQPSPPTSDEDDEVARYVAHHFRGTS